MLSVLLAGVVISSVIVLVRLFVALWMRSGTDARAGERTENLSPSTVDRLADWINEPYLDPDSWPDEEWSLESPVCPCCHCIAQSGVKSCSVCDWEEPLDENAAQDDRGRLLAEARARYEMTGSAITADERASWGGLLTPREEKLRLEIRRSSDRMRTGEVSDSSETLVQIDRMLAELRTEEKQKRADYSE